MLNSDTGAWRPLDCVFCNNHPQKTPIYSCKEGHLVCSSCYSVLLHQVTDTNKVKLQCKLCKSEITDTRNLIAELIIQDVKDRKNPAPQQPPDRGGTRVQGDDYSTTSSEDSELSGTYYSPNKPQCSKVDEYPDTRSGVLEAKSLLNIKSVSRRPIFSARPICCPEYKCRRMVAVTALVSHFEFEHPRIMKLDVVPDVREDFVVRTHVFDKNGYYLIALLLLGDKPLRNSVPISPPKKENRLPIALLCSCVSFPIDSTKVMNKTSTMFPTTAESIKCNHAGDSGASTSHMDSGTTSKKKKSLHVAPPVSESCVMNSVNDFILVWVSGLEVESHSMVCTLELSDFNGKVLFGYRGPMNSVRDNQDPIAVLSRGCCLAVQSSILPRIISTHEEFVISVVIRQG